MTVPNCKLVRVSGGMVPKKFWNLDLPKSPETCIFLFMFASLMFLRRAIKLQGHGYFDQNFEKWGPVPPSPSSYIHGGMDEYVN